MIEAAQYYRQVQLRSGVDGVIRAIRAHDKTLLLRGFQRMSQQSAYHRFINHKSSLSEQELKALTEVDFKTHVAIVLLIEESDQKVLVGVARYFLTANPAIAECAFTVDDKHQNMGIGTILFEHLLDIAIANGVERFQADLLAENTKMLELFENSGLDLKKHTTEGITSIEFSIQENTLKRFYP